MKTERLFIILLHSVFCGVLMQCSRENRNSSAEDHAVKLVSRGPAEDDATRGNAFALKLDKKNHEFLSELDKETSLDESLSLINDRSPTGEIGELTANVFLRFLEVDERTTLDRLEKLSPGDTKNSVIVAVTLALHDKYGLKKAMDWLAQRDFPEESDLGVLYVILGRYPRGEFTSSEVENMFRGYNFDRISMEVEIRKDEEASNLKISGRDAQK